MTLKKWQLITKIDVSPNKYFPIEKRSYKQSNGTVIDDFFVTTLADVAMIVPITKDKKVVLVKQYKPGVDEIMIQFPAGRLEEHHKDLLELAQYELEEEVGIKVELNRPISFAKLSGFSTKASEKVFFYLVKDCEFNAKQKLDVTEEIEVITMTFVEMDKAVGDGTIWCSQTIAGWELAKKKFNLFSS